MSLKTVIHSQILILKVGKVNYVLNIKHLKWLMLNIKVVYIKIVILDHHITAQEALKDVPYAIFDMNQSGVGLTWSYFFPEEQLPHFLAMIQDRDLWRWQLQGSKEFRPRLLS